MTARGRLLAIKLLEIQKKKPGYLETLGVHIHMKKTEKADDERENGELSDETAEKKR